MSIFHLEFIVSWGIIWNMEQKNKLLLIWPPLIIIHHLPLGIPFLTAYLKNNGIDNIEVIDLNMAYLKRFKLFWLLYRLNKWYHSIAGDISYGLKKASGVNTKPKTSSKAGPSWKKIILSSYKFLNKKINDLLDYKRIGINKKKSIPWSLESILAFDTGSSYKIESKKIYRILKPAFKKNPFSIVGISVVYPEQLFFAFLIAKVIKERFNEDISVVLGGAQVTKHIDYIIKSGNVCDLVDFFVTDDGEEPLLKLLKELPEKRFYDIPNLYYKSEDERERYKKTKNIFYLHPKDFLVPDFKGFDLDIYRSQLPILASKGCYWSKCNFCTYASMKEHSYSMSTIEKALEVIKEMKKRYGTAKFRFVDDALPPRFMERLAQGLLNKKINAKWAGSIILHREFIDKEFCKTLKDSGLFQVAIGLESISPRILNFMNKCHKNVSEFEIKEILTNLKNEGINIGLHIIFGFPTETIDEARRTLSFLIENRNLYDTCMFQPFCLEDNTPVFNNPEKFGIARIHQDDKDSGERLGYRYEVSEGMDQNTAAKFTYQEALNAFKRVGVNVRSSELNIY